MRGQMGAYTYVRSKPRRKAGEEESWWGEADQEARQAVASRIVCIVYANGRLVWRWVERTYRFGSWREKTESTWETFLPRSASAWVLVDGQQQKHSPLGVHQTKLDLFSPLHLRISLDSASNSTLLVRIIHLEISASSFNSSYLFSTWCWVIRLWVSHVQKPKLVVGWAPSDASLEISDYSQTTAHIVPHHFVALLSHPITHTFTLCIGECETYRDSHR